MSKQNEFFCILCHSNQEYFTHPCFRLLDGNMLCSGCHKLIKSRLWENILIGRVPDSYIIFGDRPKPPTVSKKMFSFFGLLGDPMKDYKLRQEKFDRTLNAYHREKKRAEEDYHRICQYWPKETPPDWSWRRKQVLERSERKCEQCKNSSDILNIHHIIPRQKGGTHEFSNLIALCTRCHSEKKGVGHGFILPPRSREVAHERESVERIKETLGYWASSKAKSVSSCIVCGETIAPGNALFIRYDLPTSFGKRKELCNPYGNEKRMEIVRVSIRKTKVTLTCEACHTMISQGQRYIGKTSSLSPRFSERFCLDCCSKQTQIICSYCKKRYRFKI